jgi:hypothetical protein
MARKRFPDPAIAEFINGPLNEIVGALQSGSTAITWSLIELQDAFNITGDIAEIGVHQGKLFSLLCHALNLDERAHAIDIWGNPPGINVDDLEAFHANNSKIGLDAATVNILIADSQALTPAELAAQIGNDIRLFSVDGDHTRDAVRQDLALAAHCLGPAGVILADDLFNPWYPTVTEAIYDFLKGDPGDIEPIAFAAANGPVVTGAAKLFLARRAYADNYKRGLKLLNQDDLKHCDPFAGFADVPTFDFPGQPRKRALAGHMRDILDDIVEPPGR